MNIVTRAQWGARPPENVRELGRTDHLILHHFAIDRRGKAGARWCQNLHMDDRGWWDVAYSFMADHEAVYEGRGTFVEGGHTSGWNDKAHAVAAMIDGSGSVEDAILDRLAEAAVHLWREGAVTRPEYTGGHRDYDSSQCPGDELYARIPEINRRAKVLAEEGNDVVQEYAQCVVGETTADLEAGRVLAAAYDIALVRAVGEAKIVGEWPHQGVEARGGFGFCVGSAKNLVRPEHFPDGGLVIAGEDRTDTAGLIAKTLLKHPPGSIVRRGRPW